MTASRQIPKTALGAEAVGSILRSPDWHNASDPLLFPPTASARSPAESSAYTDDHTHHLSDTGGDASAHHTNWMATEQFGSVATAHHRLGWQHSGWDSDRLLPKRSIGDTHVWGNVDSYREIAHSIVKYGLHLN